MVLQRGKCTLRPLSNGAEAICRELWQEEEVIRFTNLRKPLLDEECRKRLSAFVEVNESMMFPVIFSVEYNGRMCGVAGCPVIDLQDSKFGVFYQLLQPYWGRGIGQISMNILVSYMRQKCPGAILYADVVDKNTASRRILEHAGFQIDGIEKAGFEKQGKQYDVIKFFLTVGDKNHTGDENSLDNPS